MSTQPVPMFDPQGILRDVPYSQMASAVKAGGMPAVKFMAPDKSVRFVPANRTQEAYQSGGTILPIEQQEVKHPGFWSTLLDDAKGMASGAYHAMVDYDPLSDPNLSDAAKNQIVARMWDQGEKENSARRANEPYPGYADVATPVAGMLGVNVKGMEDSAAQGDAGGVMGHAAAVPAAMAASELTGRALSARASAFRQGLASALKVDPTTIVQDAAAAPKPAPVAEAQPTSEVMPTPQAASPAKPASQPAPTPDLPDDPWFNTDDPILNRLRRIANDIEKAPPAKAPRAPRIKATSPQTPVVPDPEADLTALLKASLRQVQTQKGIPLQ